MLDHLSGGRIIAGFVRGIGTEYFASGVNPTHSHGRFYEAHELILRAWTENGPFRYHGRHYQFDYVNLWPRPLQQPHPPVWLPSQGSSETVEWGAPARKYTYLQTFSPVKSAKKAFDLYRARSRAPRLPIAALAARLGAPDLRRGNRRDRAARVQAACRGLLQQVPALPDRDAAAARLSLDRLHQGADRKQIRPPLDADDGRDADRARHGRCRQPRHRARADCRLCARARRRQPRSPCCRSRRCRPISPRRTCAFSPRR